jgi:hypothetical protein
MNPGPPNWKQKWTKISNHNYEIKVMHISKSCDRLTAPKEKGFASTKNLVTKTKKVVENLT